MYLIQTLRKKLTATGLLLTSLTALAAAIPAHAEFGLGGLEFSPARTFVSANSDDYTTYSGTVNFELGDPTTELSIPFLWSKADATLSESESHESLIVDLQWRKYDKPTRTGGYVGVLLRGVNADSYDSTDKSRNQSETDIGVGILAGFRRNISSGFYWGMNMSLVAFADEPNSMRLSEDDLFRQKVSMTFDFLKIGYSFR